MSIQIVLLSLINKVHSSKHLSVVFKRANCSCQKSYNLFLEDIDPKTAHQLLCMRVSADVRSLCTRG